MRIHLDHYEDIHAGQIFYLAQRQIRKDEMIAFARAYDPQPFHLDEEAASRSLLGSLAASGWHSCAIMMRMLCDAYVNRSAALGAPGIERLRWQAPLYPGDVLCGQVEILRKRILKSQPDVGIAHMHAQIFKQCGKCVIDTQYPFFIRVRQVGTSR